MQMSKIPTVVLAGVAFLRLREYFFKHVGVMSLMNMKDIGTARNFNPIHSPQWQIQHSTRTFIEMNFLKIIFFIIIGGIKCFLNLTDRFHSFFFFIVTIIALNIVDQGRRQIQPITSSSSSSAYSLCCYCCTE